MAPGTAVASSGTRRTLLTALLCAAPFMVVLDSNLVTVALPTIRADLGFSRDASQWVLGAFSLAFGSFLVLGGQAGDVYGQRRVLVMGLGLFVVASFAAALATTPVALLSARALQGVGSAMAFPASLSLIAVLFDEGQPRNRVLGVLGAALSGAFICGVAGGGILTELAGWRAIFLLNGPVGMAATLAAFLLVRENPWTANRTSIDLMGALAVAGAISLLLYGLGLAAKAGGWSANALTVIGGSALLGAAAWMIERRVQSPLLPPGLLRRRTLATACAAAVVTVGTGVGVMFLLTLYLQEVLEYGPSTAGVALTTLGAAGIAAGSIAPRMAERVGLVRTLAAALLVQAAGVALLIPIDADEGLRLVVVASAIVGFGHFGATVTFTALASTGVRARGQGVAMGVLSSAQQIGGALGLALLVAVARAGTRTAGADADASADHALVQGFRWALATGSALSALTAGVVLAVSRRSRCGGAPVGE